MEGWPHRDANIILYWEIVLVTCIFLMNGADAALHPNEYGFIFSSNLGPALLGGLSEKYVASPRANWMVGPHYRSPWIFNLPALLQAPAYSSCLSEYLLCPPKTSRPN